MGKEQCRPFFPYHTPMNLRQFKIGVHRSINHSEILILSQLLDPLTQIIVSHFIVPPQTWLSAQSLIGSLTEN